MNNWRSCWASVRKPSACGEQESGGGSADALLAVGSFFEIDPVALSNDDFAELLPLLAQPERFNRIEAKIKRGQLTIV